MERDCTVRKDLRYSVLDNDRFHDGKLQYILHLHRINLSKGFDTYY